MGEELGAARSAALPRTWPRRWLLRGLGGLSVLLVTCGRVPRARAQTQRPGAALATCGGNPGVEELFAYAQGTVALPTFAVDPTWPWYSNPDTPLYSFRYPPDWILAPVDPSLAGVNLYAPQGDALLGLGSTQYTVGVRIEELLPYYFQVLFEQLLRQPSGQMLCGYQMPSVGDATSWFAAAQNRTTVGVLHVSVRYQGGNRLDANSNLVPTLYTAVNYYAFAGPIERFAALTRSVFVPVISQFRFGAPFDEPDEIDEEEDEGDGVMG